TGSMLVARSLHTATLLPNGNVLVAGGIDATNANTNMIEEFAPAGGGTFAFVGTMNQARNSHAANRLAAGTVLISGGKAPSVGSAATSAAEVIDSAGTSFVLSGMQVARMSPLTATLSDGRVLVAGGLTNGVSLSSAEVYTAKTPNTGSYDLTGSMEEARGASTAVLLNDGTALVAGSSGDQTAEIFYPSGPISAASPAFSEVAIPTAPSHPHAI